jgi:hypothetical protein
MKLNRIDYDNARRTLAGYPDQCFMCCEIEFSAFIVAKLRAMLSDYGVKPTQVIMHVDAWNRMIVGPSFQLVIDPSSKLEQVTSGLVGKMYGMELVTDGFLPVDDRFMKPGEVIVCGDDADGREHHIYLLLLPFNNPRLRKLTVAFPE